MLRKHGRECNFANGPWWDRVHATLGDGTGCRRVGSPVESSTQQFARLNREMQPYDVASSNLA